MPVLSAGSVLHSDERPGGRGSGTSCRYGCHGVPGVVPDRPSGGADRPHPTDRAVGLEVNGEVSGVGVDRADRGARPPIMLEPWTGPPIMPAPWPRPIACDEGVPSRAPKATPAEVTSATMAATSTTPITGRSTALPSCPAGRQREPPDRPVRSRRRSRRSPSGGRVSPEPTHPYHWSSHCHFRAADAPPAR